MSHLIMSIYAFIIIINFHHSHRLATVDHSPGSNVVFNDKNCDMKVYALIKNACSFDNEELHKNRENFENLDDAKHIKQNKHIDTKSLISFKYYKRISEQSQIIGKVRLINSSLELKGIELIGDEIGRIVCGLRGSVVVVRGCVVEMGKDDGAGAFELGGCRGVLTNITLKWWRRGREIYSGRLFGGKGYGREKSEGEEKGSERESGRGRGREGDGYGYGEDIEGSISVSESHFSSFCVSSAPFLSSPSIPLISLSHLTFFNISTANDACSPSTAMSTKTTCMMISCSFSSVCDAYDSGIVHSLNNPLASLTASNTSFIGCCRTRNVECIGTADRKLTPGRQNTTDNGANSFTWCEWSGSRTTGEIDSVTDGISSGGAINMNNLVSGALSVKHCTFNDCYAYYGGGGIMCHEISSIKIENNSFNSCTAQRDNGGGIYAYNITSCVRISGCEFQKCKSCFDGGGFYLSTFQTSGSSCIGTESGKGESACVFECSFSSCTLSSTGGGGMNCFFIPAAFKMRSLQFISCSAESYGGGLYFVPCQSTAPSNKLYCYFFFFYDCSCNASTPYGHDVYFQDNFNHFSSNNPLCESYTTNTDEKRVCYADDDWVYQHTEKKDWLKEGMKDRYVGVGGDDTSNLCGVSEAAPCKTVGHAVESSMEQLSSTITLLGGRHVSEGATISVGEKKISVLGKGKTVSVIGTSALSNSSTTLFSISSGQLEVGHVGIDHNSMRSSSPSVFVVSLGSGTLSLEDVVIDSSTSGGGGMTKCVFEVALRQLKTIDVEIENMKISQPLFTDPSSAGSSSEESLLGNVTIRNVNRTEGDGVVIAKSVKGGETFVVWNTTMEGCECHNGNGGGLYVCLTGDGEAVVNGTSVIDGNKAENNGGSEGNGGRGGGIFVGIESGECGLTIGENVEFSKVKENMAEYGKDVFVHCGSGVLLETKVNASSFRFFDASTIPSDELKFCGSEDGKDEKVIPLFVYLFTIESKLTVDGSGERALDHSYCGFEKFGCETINYCMSTRVPKGFQTVEVSSESSINDEIIGPSFDVSVSGKVTAGEEITRVKVNVVDGGSSTQDCFVGCSNSLTICSISFVVKGQLSSRRRALIHSSSTLRLASCSVLFESGAFTGGKIGYNVLNVDGGTLTVDGFVMESVVTMNGKSPITISNGGMLEIKNSRVSGVTVEGWSGEGRGCIGAAIKEGGSAVVDNCSISTICTGGSGMKGGGMMISVENGGSLEINDVRFTGCQVPTEDSSERKGGMGGGMFVRLADTMGSFTMEGVTFSGCNAWKGKKVFISGNDLSEVMSNEKLKEELSASDKKSLDELCGWERKTTGENGYVIPLVVYLWRNWSKDGFVSKEKGGDFSGCGFSEAPCSSIDHLISLRYEPLGKGESQIGIGDSGLLSHPISFLSSLPTLPDSEAPAVAIKGTKKGTSVTITDEDGNAVSSGAMISSNVSLSFVNVSFTKPSITTSHAVFIESSRTNTVLSVTDCSFGSAGGTVESFEYCLIKVNGGSAAVQSCTLNKINELKGFIAFSQSASQVTIQNVNISSATLKENSLISMIEEENQMNGNENTHLNGNKPVLKVVYCSFENIMNEGSSASVIELGSFDYAMECTIEDCAMSTCRSDLSTEGGGMKVVLKSEESILKVNGSSFSMCRCSTESGRGGGLFIDGADPNVNIDDESQIPSLNFKIVNILFRLNEAFVGKDIFIKCHSILDQINETLFALNFNQESLRTNNSICGSDLKGNTDMDVIPRITFYKGLQVFVNEGGADGRRCGAQSNPCKSINCAIDHIQEGVMNAILIDGEGVVSGECVIGDLVVRSFKKTQAIVKLKSKIEKSAEKDCIMEFINESAVERCSFQFEDTLISTHSFILKVKNGITKIQECKFFSSSDELKLNNSIVSVESGELRISETTFRDLHSAGSVLLFNKESNVTLLETSISNIKSEGDVVSVGGKAKVVMKIMTIENVSVASERCVVAMEDAEQEVSVLNCSFEKSANSVEKGSMMQIRRSKDVRVEICVFDGEKEEKEAKTANEGNKGKEGLCEWSGSLIDIESSNVEMKETTVMKSKNGGLWVSGGSVKIENSKFEDNNPSIEGYPSARRNVICTGNGELNIVSVKGGDGIEKNTSLWILDEGCQLGGIASERGSSYFIPVLEEVKNTTQASGSMDLSIRGKLLLPCNLSLKISMKDGDVELIQTQKIEENECVSENEIHSVITSEQVEVMGKKTEVSMSILFGKGNSLSSNKLVVINKTVSPSSGDDRISEGGNKNNIGGSNFEWSLFAFIGCIEIVAILLFVIVVMAVVQRRKLIESERKVEKERLENEQIMQKMERRRRENNGGSFEMSDMPSTLLEGMTSQIPLLIDNDEGIPEPPSMIDGMLNENDLPDLESPLPFSENYSTAGVPKSHSLNVISAKKPFREKEKKNLKILHSVIHSVQGDFTLGTRVMDVVDGKEVVMAVAELFEHLISVGDERVEMMGKQLCPYSIFVEEGIKNEIFVLTEELKDEKQKEEMKRWKAPEAGDEEEGIEKAVVFTLGLVLHEMTTGEVPLSECEAEEAQEMMRDGVRPLTEGIEGEDLIELMEKMWADEPNERPTLAEVKESLRELIENDV